MSPSLCTPGVPHILVAGPDKTILSMDWLYFYLWNFIVIFSQVACYLTKKVKVSLEVHQFGAWLFYSERHSMLREFWIIFFVYPTKKAIYYHSSTSYLTGLTVAETYSVKICLVTVDHAESYLNCARCLDCLPKHSPKNFNPLPVPI